MCSHKILTLWAQFGHFHLGVYSLLCPAVLTLMAVCWFILRGQLIYTVIQAVHSLLYIVAKCNFFSVVTWKDIIKYLQKCQVCTHFCEILIYILFKTNTNTYNLKHITYTQPWTTKPVVSVIFSKLKVIHHLKAEKKLSIDAWFVRIWQYLAEIQLF